MGRYWRKNILKIYGGKLQLWPSGMDSMDWITVVPTTGDPIAPDADSIVTGGPDVDSLRQVIVDDTTDGTDATDSSASQPSQPTQPSEKENAAAAEKKRAETVMRKYQKDGNMTTGDMDVLLKMVKGGKVEPNDMMKKVMHSVVCNTKDKDGIATSYVPRMVSPKNDAKVYTKVMVAVLPRPVTTESSRSAFNKSIAKLGRIMDEMFGDDESKVVALNALADSVGVGVVDRKQELSVSETLALRRFCRVSSNQLYKISQFLRAKGVVPRLLPRNATVTAYEEARGHAVRVEKLLLLTSTSDKDATSKECLVWCLQRPAGVLEDLTCACLLSGTFEQSIDISNYSDSLLVFMGADKAGDEITNIIRVGNRKNGNHGTCCQPFARTEDGASENIFNCNRFFYSSKYPMQKFQQELLDDNLHVIVVKLVGSEGKLIDCRAITVNFVDLTPGSCATVSIGDETIQIDNDVMEGSLLGQWTDTKTGKFILATDGDGKAVGIVHEDLPSTLVFWRNNTTLPFDVSEGSIEIKAYCARGFLSHDTKQGLIVAGIGSASSSKSCLCCLQHKSKFKLYPQWMYDQCREIQGQEIPRDQVCWDDPVIRKGDHDNTKNHEKYLSMMKECTSANRSEARHLPIKVECGSVVNSPGLDTHGEKDTLAPMHASQGLMTHHSCNVRMLLRQAEAGNKWMEEVDKVEEDAKAVVTNIKAMAFDADHKAVIKLEKKLQASREELKSATDANDQARINGANVSVAHNLQQLDQHKLHRQYESRVKQLQGAEHVLEQIKAYKKKSSKKPHGPAEYRYNQSFENEAKVRFRAEHSGFELSNDDGITALRHWNKICEATTGVYDANSNDEDEAKMAKDIKVIMDESKEISRPLFWLSKFLKRQDKKTEDVVHQEFDPVMIAVSKAWRKTHKTFEDNDDSKGVFLKLHHLEYHVRNFMLRTGFYGRGSEEGKEQAHNEFSADQNIVSRMSCPVKRTETFVRRQNSSVSPELATTLQNMKGKKRGKYDTSNRRQRQRVETVTNNISRDVGFGYLEVDNRKMDTSFLIKSLWKDVYMMCAYGIIPEAWKNK